MKTVFGLLIFVSLVVGFTSCQKEIDWGLTNNLQSDSIYLKQYIELDTTLPSGLDTTYKEVYSYDAQKRIIQYTVSNLIFPLTTTSYFYSGNATLPYKAVDIYNDGIDDFRDTTYYYYSGGLISGDSSISYNVSNSQYKEISSISYTPNGNNTFISSRGYYSYPPVSPSYQWSGMIFKTYVNGNITVQDDTTTFFTVYTNRLHHQVTYDTKINPLYVQGAAIPILSGGTPQKNNITEKIMWDVPGNTTDHYQMSYVYRNDGYPVSVKITSVLNPGYVIKGLYFYTN